MTCIKRRENFLFVIALTRRLEQTARARPG
jgi:hypothetical protein